MTTPQLVLPWGLRDDAFQRRKQALDNATSDQQRTEILAVPLVADRLFEPYTHCPLGHMGEHDGGMPVNHDGRPAAPRTCTAPGCESTWLELLA